MSATCPVCEREQDAGLLCHSCTSELERELGDVAAIVGELDVTLSKQDRLGVASSGGNKPKGWDREKVPMNVGAMQAADNLGNVLTTWARDACPALLPRSPRSIPIIPAIAAAKRLLLHIDLVRRHPAVTELVDEVGDAIAQARRAVDRPADRVYLGQCLVPTPDEEGRDVTCLAEIYASPTARETRCKVCGVTHEVAERRQDLLDRAADMLFTLKEAAQMIGYVGGVTVTESRIRGYIHRPSNALNYRPGTKLIRLGDLLAVVLDESERKGAA